MKESQKQITQEVLKELLDYDPETGIFTWTYSDKVFWKNKGRSVRTDVKYYVCIKIFGKAYKAHRLAWLYMTGEWPDKKIDHKNRIGTDNRWENLRLATNSQNGYNALFDKTKTSSKYKGVSFISTVNRWDAHITCNGKRYTLGKYFSEIQAAEAYNKAAKELHGEFAVLNDIDYSQDNTISIVPVHSKSPYLGVSKKDTGWQAQIMKDYKKIYIGYFSDPVEAAKAYDKKALELKGPKAKFNFPELLDLYINTNISN